MEREEMGVMDPSLKGPNFGEETRDLDEDEETTDRDSMDVEVEYGTPPVPSSCMPVALQYALLPPSFLE